MDAGRTRCDKNKRITLLKEIADLMMIQEGDYIKFIIKDGIVSIEKETKLYNGFDIENMEITNRLRKYEEVMEMLNHPMKPFDDEDILTPEEEFEMKQDLEEAYRQYNEDLLKRMKRK